MLGLVEEDVAPTENLIQSMMKSHHLGSLNGLLA